MTTRSRESALLRRRESSSSLPPTNGSTSKDSATSVHVALRIRPVTDHDLTAIPARWQRSVVQSLSSCAVQVDASGQAPPGATAMAPGMSKKQAFTFDRVLGPADGQEEVYNNSVKALISRFMEGYNVTILAYGQTSSGKSYTMGTALADIDFESLVAGQQADPQMGIIPRAVAQIFSEIKSSPAARTGAVQYTAKASFIEIYNEELIDLLADGEGDNRPLVQIREDKAGHIIWSGLKEVRVQSVADVMNRLLQGSSIRRTNETDMNAQSSRSHAIFSLTMTQRKYVGNGNPPSAPVSGIRPPSSFGMRSQTPTGRTTPTGRASGLPRPASSIPTGANKLSSPSRSGTPGGGSSFGLRPASVAFGSGTGSQMGDDRGTNDSGEWVTVTSKFHFVDLAGSERLKRTAAQGERVKEGISINSGLHALGNVISALGDPAKSKRTTHIPYRDSKLTRLLQDSLGGNAHTLMIACVSPTEYNVSETINTLQYANRARNIKNRAEINEVENGWDDIEYLQGQVLKLRKELQLLKGFKAGTPGSDAALRASDQKEVLEWQAKYASLSQKFSQLTAEATRLQQQSSKGSLSQDEYYKAAEPIIIEYEKTVDALEGQINLQKAALGHCEDIILAGESLAKEQEDKMAIMERELEGREQTITELQARLTKVGDREATADAYARDLESRLATHTVNGHAEANIVADLRKDVARLRESEGNTEKYIKDLESRLAKSEENTLALRDQISRLEKEVVRREEAYKDLQQRMDMLDSTMEKKALVQELDERDAMVLELQQKLDELQIERDEIVRERGRLTEAAASRQLEKGRLEDQIRELQSKVSTSADSVASSGLSVSGGNLAASMSRSATQQTANRSMDSSQEHASAQEELGFLQTQVDMLTEELKARQENSERLQAEMESITAQHGDAIAEISELTRQLSVLKSNGPSTPMDEYTTPGESPSLSRRGSYNFGSTGLRNRGRPESLLLDNTPGKRKSLSRRSSSTFLGYNPKESTPRDGTSTPATAHVPPLPIQTAADGSPTLYRTRSLSQSFGPDSSSGGRRKLSLSGSADFAKLGFAPESITSGPSSPLPTTPIVAERRIASLEAETLRLQEVLKERDEEIAALERQTKIPSQPVFMSNGNSKVNFPFTSRETPGMGDEQANDMDELMRAMARKETEARRQIEEMTTQLQKVHKERNASQSVYENQLSNMVSEMESMRQREAQLSADLQKARKDAEQERESIRTQMGNDRIRLQQDHEKSLKDLESSHSTMKEELVAVHANRLQGALKNAQAEHELHVATLLKSKEEEHAGIISTLRDEHGTALSAAVEEAHQRHIKTLGETEAEAAQRQREERLASEREYTERSANEKAENARVLEQSRSALQDEHSKALKAMEESFAAQFLSLTQNHQKATEESRRAHQEALAGHEAALNMLQKEHADKSEIIRKEHLSGLDALKMEHASVTEKLQADHVANLTQLREEHASALALAHQEHATALSKVQKELKDSVERYTQLLQTTESEKGDNRRDLERMQQNHLHTLEQLEALKSAHSERLRTLTDEHGSRVNQLEANLQEAVTTRDALATTHEELETKYNKLLEQDPRDVDVLRSELAETSDALVTLEAALTETQEERDRLLKELQGASSQTRAVTNTGVAPSLNGAGKDLAQAQKEVELLQASLANVRSELQRSKSDIQGMLEDKTRYESALREMQIKLTIAETRSSTNRRNSRELFVSPSNSDPSMNGDLPRSPLQRRESSESDAIRGNRSLGVSASSKPPPLTPPPSVPPPPTPSGSSTPTQMQRNSAGIRSSTSSSSLLHHRPDSPGGTLTRSSSSTSINSPSLHGLMASDPKAAKLLSDQSEELRNLAKQLNHCEMDLQANIDLVATLEAALNDSERNLRKSRLQLSEATRERDRYAMQVDELRSQVSQAQQETDSVRNSVMLEKQGYESKLQMEREAKEKARRALEARLDEVQKKKSGKLFCM